MNRTSNHPANSQLLAENTAGAVAMSVSVPPRIAIILPAFNEAMTIARVLADFHKACPAAEIVVVDNNSTDGTGDIARGVLIQFGMRGRVLVEPNQGKANAVRCAL